MEIRLDHIGIAVNDLDQAEKFWNLLGISASQPDEDAPAESRDAQADNRPDKTTTPDDADTGENIGNNTAGAEETGQHPDSSAPLLRQETELIHHAEKLPQRPGEAEELLPQNRPRPRRMVFTKKQENT